MTARVKKYIVFAFIAAVTAALCLLPHAFAALANSADRYWHSESESAGVLHRGDCPLEVTHEKLTFDIPSFPDYFSSEEEFEKYDSSVTAEYTFFNPTEHAVTARLAFPFGKPSEFGNDLKWDDTERYDVCVNGAAVEKRLRHTYCPRYYGDGFNAEKELEKLCDEKISRWFFTPQTAVTYYTYRVHGIASEGGNDWSPYASATLPKSDTRRIVMSEYNGGETLSDRLKAGFWAENGKEICVYTVGEPLQKPPEWTLYSNGSQLKYIDGKVELVNSGEISFYEFATSKLPESGNIMPDDWYNAVTEAFCAEIKYYVHGIDDVLNPADRLMRWYEYSLVVPAGAAVTNSVCAPLYPSINGWYEPPVYDYEYLLSPAKRWSAFGSLDIEIVTPRYLTDANGFGFEKTERGYSLSLNGLPDGDLLFSLCEVQNPKSVHNYGSPLWVIIPIAVTVLIALSCVFALVVLLRYKKTPR